MIPKSQVHRNNLIVFEVKFQSLIYSQISFGFSKNRVSFSKTLNKIQGNHRQTAEKVTGWLASCNSLSVHRMGRRSVSSCVLATAF